MILRLLRINFKTITTKSCDNEKAENKLLVTKNKDSTYYFHIEEEEII